MKLIVEMDVDQSDFGEEEVTEFIEEAAEAGGISLEVSRQIDPDNNGNAFRMMALSSEYFKVSTDLDINLEKKDPPFSDRLLADGGNRLAQALTVGDALDNAIKISEADDASNPTAVKAGKGIADKLRALKANLLKEPLPPSIRVWPFHEAPPSLKALSGHGGDEDWLAYIPVEFADRHIPWADEATPFGVCNVETHDLGNGGKILIGAHA